MLKCFDGRMNRFNVSNSMILSFNMSIIEVVLECFGWVSSYPLIVMSGIWSLTVYRREIEDDENS